VKTGVLQLEKFKIEPRTQINQIRIPLKINQNVAVQDKGQDPEKPKIVSSSSSVSLKL
jgi:hypothetical protein